MDILNAPNGIFSILPDLLNYSMLGVLIIRVSVGWTAFWAGIKKIKSKENRMIGQLMVVLGALIFTGAFTQIAGLALSIVIIADSAVLHLTQKTKNPYFYIILFAASLSLLFLGAGPFSFDLPI